MILPLFLGVVLFFNEPKWLEEKHISFLEECIEQVGEETCVVAVNAIRVLSTTVEEGQAVAVEIPAPGLVVFYHLSSVVDCSQGGLKLYGWCVISTHDCRTDLHHPFERGDARLAVVRGHGCGFAVMDSFAK